MENTSNFLSSAWQEIKDLGKLNPAYSFLIVLLLTIPLGYAVSSIATGIFTLITLITFKKNNFKWEKSMILPILFYFLLASSIFWTNDVQATTKAISKVLPLLVFPVCFMILPKTNTQTKQTIIKYYSIGIVFFAIFYILRSAFKFIQTQDISVFFYHELVTEDVNAIHVSVYAAVAFFYFFNKEKKTMSDKIGLMILAIFIVLLSSKNIILIFFLLILVYELFFFKVTPKIKLITFLLLISLGFIVVYSSKIRDRFQIEFQSNQKEGTINKNFAEGTVYNVSVYQAWNKEKFQPNEYFAGAAFRVYQLRIFKEMLQEDNIFFQGYGLNATDFKIEQKGIENNVFLGNEENEGYQKKNFHNQYVQTFAECGIFALVLLVMILFLSLKNAFKNKDFVHFCFAVLMISLFLTESFLARQRGIIFFTLIYCIYNSGISKNLISTSKTV